MWGGILLAALLALTWGARAVWTSETQAHVEERRRQAAEEALRYAHQQFSSTQEALMHRARALAGEPAVAQGLRARMENPAGPDAEAAARQEALVQRVARLALPGRVSAEVYDAALQLAAWKGHRMPLSERPVGEEAASGAATGEAARGEAAAGEDAPSLAAPRTVIARDGSVRYALVAWHPVRDGAQTIGAVRTVQFVQFEAPVQNQYLENYSLEEAWSEATQLSVSVWLGETEEPSATSIQGPPAFSEPLRSLDGRVLGRVSVTPPSAEGLLQQGRQWFGDLMALWGALLMTGLCLGLWQHYRTVRAAERASSETTVHERLLRTSGAFALWAAAWWGLRYALLLIDVPARWQRAQAPLAPLFDPKHLASSAGGGLMQSTGDLLITGGFAFLFAAAFLHLAARFRRKGADLFHLRARLAEQGGERPSRLRFFGVMAGTASLALGLAAGLAFVARRAVLDSTLDYFARTGLLPEPLMLIVCCGLLMTALAVVALIAGASWVAFWMLTRYWPGQLSAIEWGAGIVLAVGAPLAVAYGALGMGTLVAWPAALAVLVAGTGAAGAGFASAVAKPGGALEVFTLRRLLPSMLLAALLLYPLLYANMDAQRRTRLADAAAAFSEGGDPRAEYSIEQVLDEAVGSDAAPLFAAPDSTRRRALDSLATRLLRGSLLSSLGTYRASLAFFDAEGESAGSYAAASPSERRVAETADAQEFDVLRQMYDESRAQGPLIGQLTGRRDRDRFQFAGLSAIGPGQGRAAIGSAADSATSDGDRPVGWVMVRAEPQTLAPEIDTPFPRALLPSGYYGNLYANLSQAEFREGTLVRSLGRDFGRYRLTEPVRRALTTQPALWRTEAVRGGRTYLTYYERQAQQQRGAPIGAQASAGPASASVVAVRVPATGLFDHLYYILRLVVAGLCIGGPLYLVGLGMRWQQGVLLVPQTRFRDKVLNTFLAVGAVTVVLVGFVGLQLLRGENEQATQSWLRQRLEQVEETLVLESGGEELPYRTAQRIGIDSLAVRVGLDLNLYEGPRLIATSRPRLERERLIDGRLPAEAYEALYYDGHRFATTQEYIGSFPYTVGFRALTDEQGRPRYVLSVPTLPEQERIEEEQSRAVAYLFGALLLLVVLVVGTASLLAGALTRPIERLRAGLEAVGRGESTRRLPVETSDEIGELVHTYNRMRDQLGESRRKLAQQERELAWREMARQVAHEIKNPLTPMKLSVQHLQRAYDRLEVPGSTVPEGALPGGGDGAGEEDAGRFRDLFRRITGTLIEQIDALARIANEFHSFARLPTRQLEALDLGAVVREAAVLMQEEAGTDIELDLHPEPLVVEADQEELRRMYINLIKNAIQAIPDGRAGLVRVSATREAATEEAPHGWAQSRVTDNGAGIPADLRDKIFQPNFSTKNSGTGLGLAIVRKGVEEMNGTVGFETTEGEGTTFWIRLPLVE